MDRETKTKRIEIRVTPDEKKNIMELAKDLKLTVSQLIVNLLKSRMFSHYFVEE